jgi:hypothetical protein
MFYLPRFLSVPPFPLQFPSEIFNEKHFILKVYFIGPFSESFMLCAIDIVKISSDDYTIFFNKPHWAACSKTAFNS